MPLRKQIRIDNAVLSYLISNLNADVTLVFLHGNSGSASFWNMLLNAGLPEHYCCLAFDLPAHGSSSVLYEEDYNVVTIAGILSSALKKIRNNGHFILIGFSLGANIAAEMLPFLTQVKGMSMISPTIVGREVNGAIKRQSNGIAIFSKATADVDEVRSVFGKEIKSIDKEAVFALTESFLRVSPSFRPALSLSAANAAYSDEVAFIKKSALPVLILFGADDGFVDVDYLDDVGLLCWRRIFKISGAGHFLPLDKPKEIHELLEQYVFEQTGI